MAFKTLARYTLKARRPRLSSFLGHETYDEGRHVAGQQYRHPWTVRSEAQVILVYRRYGLD